jgi:hypothetical protein
VILAFKWVLVFASARHIVLTGAHPFERWMELPGPRGWFPTVFFLLAIYCFPIWVCFHAGTIGTLLSWLAGTDTGSVIVRWDSSSGLLEILREPPVHVSAEVNDYIVATKIIDRPVDQLTLEIPFERLKGLLCGILCRVVDAETGAPLSRVGASLLGATKDRPELVGDGRGEIRKADLLPGVYTLAFHAPDHDWEMRQVDLAPAQQNDLGTIALGKGTLLRGRFIDPEGRPVHTQASIYSYSEDRPLEALNTGIMIGLSADENGRFEADLLSRRKYLIVSPFNHRGPATNGWPADPILVDLARGPIEDLVIPVRIAVDLVLRPVADEARDFEYWILSTTGLPCAHGDFPRAGDERISLVPGSHRLLLGRDPSSVREFPFELRSDPLTISIPP